MSVERSNATRLCSGSTEPSANCHWSVARLSLARLSLALARSAPRSASVHPAIPDPSHDRHTTVTRPSANRHTTVRDLRAQRKLPRAHAHAAHAHHSDRRSAARMGASNEDPNTRFLVRSGPAATRAHTTRAMSPCCSRPPRVHLCDTAQPMHSAPSAVG